MPASSATAVRPPPRGRSAVTNGKRLFVVGTSNSAWSRRYRDLVREHASDLGGVESLSQAQLSLIRRVSAIEVELEQQEGRLSLGQEIDLASFSTLTNTLRRVLESLGIKRVTKDVLDLSSYLAIRRSVAEAQEPGA